MVHISWRCEVEMSTETVLTIDRKVIHNNTQTGMIISGTIKKQP